MRAIPEVSFSEFQHRLGLPLQRVPFTGTVETTFRCNLQCVHCYVNQPAGSAAEQARELPLDRLLRLVDEVADAGCLEVLFTGGEVLVRPDFPELYLHALRRGLVVTVFTNGTMITERIADLFDEYRPHAVEVSLYGMTRETYEKVTRVPGSYDKCMEGIARLVRRGIPLRLKTIALTWNRHEIEAMEAYARSLGLDFRFDSFLNPRVDCGANRNGELQLSPEQAIALDLADPERLRDLKDFCERFVRPLEGIEAEPGGGSEHVYTCGAGHTSFTVDPYGHLQMCQLSRRQEFDLREGSFDEGWTEVFPQFRARKWHTDAACRRCSLISLCSSCPGAAEMESGDLEGIVPQFCEITHLRAFTVMGEVAHHRRDATCCLGTGRGSAPALGPGWQPVPLQRRPPARAVAQEP